MQAVWRQGGAGTFLLIFTGFNNPSIIHLEILIVFCWVRKKHNLKARTDLLAGLAASAEVLFPFDLIEPPFISYFPSLNPPYTSTPLIFNTFPRERERVEFFAQKAPKITFAPIQFVTCQPLSSFMNHWTKNKWNIKIPNLIHLSLISHYLPQSTISRLKSLNRHFDSPFCEKTLNQHDSLRIKKWFYQQQKTANI